MKIKKLIRKLVPVKQSKPFLKNRKWIIKRKHYRRRLIWIEVNIPPFKAGYQQEF